VIASFCVSALGTALLFHNYDIFAEQGLGRDLATQVFVPLGFILLLSNILTGYLLDRVPPRFVLSAAQALLGFVLIMSTQLSPQNFYFYGIAMGLMMGMMGTLSNIVYAYYFGRKHLGAIKGQVTTIGVAASAIGPVILSSGKDLFGSYELIILIVASIPFLIALIAPFVKPPKKQLVIGT
jgi:MFS family permease